MEDTKDLLLSGSTLIGTSVYNARDEKLGDIKDLMLDVDRGSVSYAVLSVSDGLFSSKYFAVPLEAMRFQKDESKHRIILDVRENWLEESPGFDKDQWPSSADPTFVNKMHSYYNTRAGYDTTAGYDSKHESVTHG